MSAAVWRPLLVRVAGQDVRGIEVLFLSTAAAERGARCFAKSYFGILVASLTVRAV